MSCVSANEAPAKKPEELRGTVMDVLRGVLGNHESSEAVLGIVAKLVSRNEELETLLARARVGKHTNERVSKEQLDLFLDKLRELAKGDLEAANAELEKVSEKNGGRADPERPAKQPPVRKPAPPELPRKENPIPVPASERPCPVCGTERTCLGHETTEVIELKSAEVYVRRDTREVLACATCESEVVRSPMGDKVVVGGLYGPALVSKLVVGKYDYGMPLYRQGEELERLGLKMPSSSMSDQITWAAELLRPIWRVLIFGVLTAHVMHLDGTSLPVLDRDSPKVSVRRSVSLKASLFGGRVSPTRRMSARDRRQRWRSRRQVGCDELSVGARPRLGECSRLGRRAGRASVHSRAPMG